MQRYVNCVEPKLHVDLGRLSVCSCGKRSCPHFEARTDRTCKNFLKRSFNRYLCLGITDTLHQPRIELGAQRWQRWILPLNHWCRYMHFDLFTIIIYCQHFPVSPFVRAALSEHQCELAPHCTEFVLLPPVRSSSWPKKLFIQCQADDSHSKRLPQSERPDGTGTV
jgi:hypothetical protein